MEGLDYIILIGYLLFLLCIGWRQRNKQDNLEQYFIGGRKAGPIALMALWMTSWVGGASIVGNAEQAYNMGINSLWYPGAIALGCIIFAVTFSGRLKEHGDTFSHLTYPDFLEKHYGTPCRLAGTITTVFAYVGYVAGQLLSAAVILNVLAGWSTEVSLLVATSVTIFYTTLGGFSAMSQTSRVQAFIIFFGLLFFGLPASLHAVGGMQGIIDNLPATFFHNTTMTTPAILALFISVGMTFYTSMDSYTRCFSAKSINAACNGTLLAALLVSGIGGAVCIMGMASRVLFSNPDSAMSAFIMLILHVFPAGGKGLMLIVILSAIMSTANSCILTASANLTHDVYRRFINPQASQQKLVGLGRWSGILVGGTGALIAYLMQDIIALLCMAFTINAAGLFFPTVTVFWGKWGTRRAAFWSISASLVTVLCFYTIKLVSNSLIVVPGTFHATLMQIDPLWPGLAVSLVLFTLLSWREHKKVIPNNY